MIYRDICKEYVRLEQEDERARQKDTKIIVFIIHFYNTIINIRR